MASIMLSVVRIEFELREPDRSESSVSGSGELTRDREPTVEFLSPAIGEGAASPVMLFPETLREMLELFEGFREYDWRGKVPYGLRSRRVVTSAITSPFCSGGALYCFSPPMWLSSIVSWRVAFVLLSRSKYLRVTARLSAYSARFSLTMPSRGFCGASGSPCTESCSNIRGLILNPMMIATHLFNDELQLARLQVHGLPVDRHLNSDVHGLTPFDVVLLQRYVGRPATRIMRE